MARDAKPNHAKLLGGILGTLCVLILAKYFLFGTREAFVEGTVTLDGTPLADVQLVFIADAEAKQGPVVTQSNSDGKFKLVGNNGPGVALGNYLITANKKALKDGSIPAGEALEKARQEGLLVNQLPALYENQTTTTLLCVLKNGSNTINVELKKIP